MYKSLVRPYISRFKALRELVGRLSMSVGKENGPKWGPKIVIKPLTSYNLGKQCRPWSVAAFCRVWSWSALFASVPVQVLQITLFTRYSDKNSATINNGEFVQTCGLISFTSMIIPWTKTFGIFGVCILRLACVRFRVSIYTYQTGKISTAKYQSHIYTYIHTL